MYHVKKLNVALADTHVTIFFLKNYECGTDVTFQRNRTFYCQNVASLSPLVLDRLDERVAGRQNARLILCVSCVRSLVKSGFVFLLELNLKFLACPLRLYRSGKATIIPQPWKTLAAPFNSRKEI